MCDDLNVNFLGSLPLDPKLARCCDEGKDFISEMPGSPAVNNLKIIIESEYISLQFLIRIDFNCDVFLQKYWNHAEILEVVYHNDDKVI